MELVETAALRADVAVARRHGADVARASTLDGASTAGGAADSPRHVAGWIGAGRQDSDAAIGAFATELSAGGWLLHYLRPRGQKTHATGLKEAAGVRSGVAFGNGASPALLRAGGGASGGEHRRRLSGNFGGRELHLLLSLGCSWLVDSFLPGQLHGTEQGNATCSVFFSTDQFIYLEVYYTVQITANN